MSHTITSMLVPVRCSFLTLFLIVLATVSHAQTIRRCNNNPGVSGPNVYTSIQAAHDASANGDVVYLEASGTSYGTLSCAKRLTIYGRGYYLSTNPAGNDSQVEAFMGNVSFGNGSNNTVLSGVVVQGVVTFGTSLSGITVERSYLSDGVVFNSTCTGATSQFAANCTIKQCFINTGGITGSCGTVENNANRITIANCILNTNYSNSTIRLFNNALVSQNVMYGINRLVNSGVTNCLIGNDGVSNNTATTFTNCICRSGGLPDGNGNQNGVDFTTVFVANTASPFGPDTNYQLSSGSPARGAGTNGTDVGAFGGANPYVLSGQPPIPIITNLVSSPSGNNNAPLTVKISIRSNN